MLLIQPKSSMWLVFGTRELFIAFCKYAYCHFRMLDVFVFFLSYQPKELYSIGSAGLFYMSFWSVFVSYASVCVFGQVDRSPHIYIFVDPTNPEQRLLVADINKHQFLYPDIWCLRMYISACICSSLWSRLCAYVYVRMWVCKDVREFCAVMPACLTRHVLLRIHIQHFLLSFCFTFHPPHFSVVLDRTSFAAGSSIKFQHPKACEFWRPL